MKRFFSLGFLSLVVLFTILNSAEASVSQTTVICNNCTNVGYKDAALTATQSGGVVLVMDFQRNKVSRFIVDWFEEEDGGPFGFFAFQVSVRSSDRDLFNDAVFAYSSLINQPEVCGPETPAFFDDAIPDGWWGPACQRHDNCYAAGGNAADRFQCDQQFLTDLYGMEVPQKTAFAYFIAVRAGGFFFFVYTSGSSEEDGDVIPTRDTN